MVTLECVTGFSAPPPAVQWEKDNIGQLFNGGTQSQATYGTENDGGARQMSMRLDLISGPEHTGNYYCVSSNTLTTEVVRSPAIPLVVDGENMCISFNTCTVYRVLSFRQAWI